MLVDHQHKFMQWAEDGIAGGNQVLAEVAWCLEVAEIQQNAFAEFARLGKEAVSKCQELVLRLKDVEDYDKRVLDFFSELVLKHVATVVRDSEVLRLEHTEVSISVNRRTPWKY
jgi:hypothetical protein